MDDLKKKLINGKIAKKKVRQKNNSLFCYTQGWQLLPQMYLLSGPTF